MKKVILAALLACFSVTPSYAQEASPGGVRATQSQTQFKQNSNAILLTIFLKHDQSMTVDEIKAIQEKQGFFRHFPPAGTRVVGWYVMMGIGQVVILEVPASKLRDVNLAIEKTAWKAFRSEFYPTYNLYPVIRDKLGNQEKLGL